MFRFKQPPIFWLIKQQHTFHALFSAQFKSGCDFPPPLPLSLFFLLFSNVTLNWQIKIICQLQRKNCHRTCKYLKKKKTRVDKHAIKN